MRDFLELAIIGLVLAFNVFMVMIAVLLAAKFADMFIFPL